MMLVMCAGFLEDLRRIDPVAHIWEDLSGPTQGPMPSPRQGLGMAAAADGRVYIFGGEAADGKAPPSAA